MHLHIRRWVIWWFFIGVLCGVIVVVNIVGHQLTPAQEKLLLLIGVAHWLLFGIVCWAFESVRIEERRPPSVNTKAVPPPPERYWHPASDFLLPGKRKSLLPWRH